MKTQQGSAQTIHFSFLRIATSLLILIQIFSIYQDIPLIYGKDGFVAQEINDIFNRNININYLIDLVAKTDAQRISYLYFIIDLYCIALISLLLGLYSNLSAFIVWLLNWLFISSSLLISYGYDFITNSCLFYCMLLPNREILSVDAYFQKRAYPTTIVSVFTIILRIHICIIYFFSGINKVVSTQWWNGEAIWRSVMQPPFQTFDAGWLVHYPVLLQASGILVIAVELLYPLLVWQKRTRYITLVVVIGMHLFIGLFLNLWLFAGIMITLNLSAFGKPIMLFLYVKAKQGIDRLHSQRYSHQTT